MAGEPSHPAYRPDIDGLRAVAVLSVVGYHALDTVVPGGFVGVDIFFVISGYLITTIIVGNLERARFRYLDFYARRIKRIFPALILVLVAVWITGWLRLFPDEYRQLGKHVAAGSGFVSNLVLRREAGYFDNAAETKPLLHLWSLAIEEQFYIFWPLILTLSFRRLGATWVIATIAVASFSFGVAVMSAEPLAAFYSPLSRFWELMIGGLLAQAVRHHATLFERYRNLRSFAGLLLIGVSIATFARWVPYPGWRALLPTVGAFLVISAGPDAWGNRFVLSHPIATWFGRISYPLYLWHWPLLSFLFIDRGDETGWKLRFVLVLASVVLAWLTYRFVENPIRNSRNVRSIPLGLMTTMAAVGVVGYGTFAADGFPSRLGARGEYAALFDEATPEMRYRTRNHLFAAYREECNFYDFDAWRAGHATNVPRAAIDPTCYTRPAGAAHTIFLWGDSHAEDLNSGLRAFLPSDIGILQVATSGCAANLPELDQESAGFCRKSNAFAIAAIAREKPDVVVIAQREGHSIARFRTIARALRQIGIRHVLVLGPIPQWTPDLDKVIASHYWEDTPERLSDHLDVSTIRTNQRLETNVKQDEPFVFIDLFKALCNAEGCRTYFDGDKRDKLITFDYGHLTPYASAFVARTIVGPAIMEALGAAPAPQPASQPASQPDSHPDSQPALQPIAQPDSRQGLPVR